MLPILVVIGLVLAVVLFFALRKKPAELPPPDLSPPAKPIAEAPAPKKQFGPAPSEDIPISPAAPETPPPQAVHPDDVVSEVARPRPKSSAPPPPLRASEPPLPRDVAGLRKGLSLSRGGFIARLTALFSGRKDWDPALLSSIEEVLLSADVGVKTTSTLMDRLKERMDRNELSNADSVWSELRSEAKRILSAGASRLRLSDKPTVVLMLGVNGVGKTTTIGKLATRFHAQDKKVLMAAGDTFRAAAVQQLEVWGKRAGVEVAKGKEGADPGAVAFDATTRAKEMGADLLLVDTAGRLHTKVPLMDEIKKVVKTVGKALPSAPHETLLVLDATTGQNALTQAQMFKEAVPLTGIVLTKLDGTAKGGIVLGICDELKIPVRYIGIGERAEDLREFHADEFVEALFGQDDSESGAG